MPEDDQRAVEDVVETIKTAIAKSRELGGSGIDLLGSGVDDAVRSLVDGRVRKVLEAGGVEHTTAASSSTELAKALEPGGGASSAASGLGKAAGRLAGRSKLARAVGGRTPAGMALRFGPILVDTVTSGLRSIDAAATHLAVRAREAGVEPHPDRVRTAVVQALTGTPVDPASEADHVSLARTWLAEVGSGLAPLGLGRLAGRIGPRVSPASVVAALADVAVTDLR